MSLKHRKLGRTSDQRRAMLRAMVTYLLENGQIKTTITRAKEVAPLAEKMITLAKQNDLAAYRQALGFITKEDVAKKLFQELGPKYAGRQRRLHPALSASVPAAATPLRWPSSSWCNSKISQSESPPAFRAGGLFSFRAGRGGRCWKGKKGGERKFPLDCQPGAYFILGTKEGGP